MRQPRGVQFLVAAAILLPLSACETAWWVGSGAMRPYGSGPRQEDWKQFELTQEMIEAAPGPEKNHDFRQLNVAIWNESGRQLRSTNCYQAADPFKCLLEAIANGRSARIDVEEFRVDWVAGWGVAVAPDHSMTIFRFALDHGWSLEYFKCETPAVIDNKAMHFQHALCSRPYYGLDTP